MSTKTHVMVVDDDIDLRESVCELLNDQGYWARPFENGATALAYLRSGECKPALILLDLMMPGMNGWDFREHQLADEALADIPVVVMTASRNLHENPIKVDEILLKPFKLRALLSVIESHTKTDAA